MSSESSQPWFALLVRTGGEPAVDQALRSKSYDTLLPTYRASRPYSDRIKKVDTALFPGYLFCRLDPDKRLPVLTTPGIYDIVRFGEKLASIEETEIEAIRRVMEAGSSARPWPYLKTGDRARIVFGSLAGLEGILVSEKGGERLVLSITLLQRSVAVDIERSWIQPMTPYYRTAIAGA